MSNICIVLNQYGSRQCASSVKMECWGVIWTLQYMRLIITWLNFNSNVSTDAALLYVKTAFNTTWHTGMLYFIWTGIFDEFDQAH
jgi:hypothetical protein